MGIDFELAEAVAILRRTPRALAALLDGLPEPWLACDEGEETFSPWDVVAHLLHGERTDWMPRLRIILEHGEDRPFDPFGRRAHRIESAGMSMGALLREFEKERAQNLAELEALAGHGLDLELTGMHPELGVATVRQLLAAWVVHDLGHLRQIVRVMASQYGDEVGPWLPYLPVLSG